MLGVYSRVSLAFPLIIVLAWHVFPRLSPFFILMKIKQLKDVVLQNPKGQDNLLPPPRQYPQGQDNLLPPPRSLILESVMTHDRFGRSHLHPTGQLLTHTRQSDGVPNPDGDLMVTVGSQILHYRRIYLDHPNPIAFMPLAVNTSGRLYDDFFLLFFFHTHRGASVLCNEVPRNRISFDFFVLLPWLILRVLLPWFWLKPQLYGCPSPLTFHLGLSYHCLVSSVLVDPHLF